MQKKTTVTYSEARYIERLARAAAKEENERKRSKPKKEGMSLGQARNMIRERMEAIMMQDRSAMRNIYNRFDRKGRGYMNPHDFQTCISAFGVDIGLDESKKVMSKFCELPGKMSFNDFVCKFLGFPNDFFTMDLMKPEDSNSTGTQMKSLRKVLPAGTSFKDVERLFRTRLRSRLFNVDGAVILGLKRGSINDKVMDDNQFFNSLMANNLMVSRKQMEEIMRYFDQNRDGKVDYVEVAHELLQLPRPGHVKHVKPFYAERSGIGAKAKEVIQKLAIICERTAAPPARIFSFFKGFDKDGSGSISYDEVELMVREFGCEVEGMNTASLLLDFYTQGRGVLSYNEFVTNVIGLQADALREKPGSTTPATHEIMEAASEGLKDKMFSQGGKDRVFEIFDRDGGGTISLREFSDGVKRMGLPVNQKQIDQLFHQFDSGKSGKLNMVAFTRDIMGMDGGMKQVNPTPVKTSRGGAPQMPKEFRENRPKTTSTRAQTSMEEHHHAQMELGNTHRSFTPEPSRAPRPKESRREKEDRRRAIPQYDAPSLDTLGIPPPKTSSSAGRRDGMRLGDRTNRLSATRGSSDMMSQTMRSLSSEAWSSPVPTHRRKNVGERSLGPRTMGGNYVGNFFVADGGTEAAFTKSQVKNITQKAGLTPLSRTPTHRQRSPSKPNASAMISDVRALPHFVQTSTLGRADPMYDA